ncbi:hypothetical protein ACIBAG_31910 [Streptomyces sp. NPDC051243]|uniref:hypothetical protein n=1 Tax=Streptomyces sp. NPDC051243 TaxID=3365646 RepID=UPI00379974FB
MEPALTQLVVLTAFETHRLDRMIVAISVNPALGTLLRDYVAQPASPAAETTPVHSPAGAARGSHPTPHPSGLPNELVALQQTADDAHRQLLSLDDHGERDRQRRAWLEVAWAAQGAVTRYATSQGLNRYDVERQLRQVVRHPEMQPGAPL